MILIFILLSFIFPDNDVSYLIDKMKQSESKPTLFVENKIDSIRKYINTEIENSSYKYKQELKDSINSIPIFIVDLSKVKGGEASGCQVFFKTKDIYKNAIFIDDNVSNDKVSSIILHELYHFITKIEKIDYTRYLDDNVMNNDDILLNKISLIITGNKYTDLSNDKQPDIKKLTDKFIIEKPYLTEKNEYTVRILEMKNWLIAEGKIKNISEDLKRSDLKHIFLSRNRLKTANFMDILPFMNFNLLFPINDI